MIKEVKFFFKEHIDNRQYIWKLAFSKAKEETQKTTLGIYWDVIRDAVFFVAYGFFILVMRGSSGDMEGMPRLVYLFTGLVGWYMISDNLNQGVGCIVKNKHIFTKIKFPIMIIPTIETLALYIKRSVTLVLLAVVLVILMLNSDFRIKINLFGVIYAIGASFLFGVSYNLFMSGFYTISKDFRSLYKAIVRIQFYFVPVFWSVAGDLGKLGAPKNLITAVENLPFIHLVNSFRNAVAVGKFPPLYSIGIFAVFVTIMFCLGCYIQYRLRRVYADFV